MSQQNPPVRKRRLWLSLVFGVLVLAGFAIVLMMQFGILRPPPRQLAPFPSPAADRDGRWRQDVQYLGSQLAYLHADAFHKTNRDDYDKAVSLLDASVPDWSDRRILVEMMRLVAMVGDGHTAAKVHESAGFRRFPIRLSWLGAKLYVTEATEDYEKAIGAELVSIGENNVQTIYDQVKPLVSSDNEPDLRNAIRLLMVTPEVLESLNLLPTAESGDFTFEDSTGEHFTLTLTPVNPLDSSVKYRTIYEKLGVELPLSARKRDDFYWYQYLPDAKALFFQYNVYDDKQSQPFHDFNTEMFKFIDGNPVERLIIDLRYNGGGNSAVLSPFFDEALKRPALNQKGKLFVLIGAQTFSSALMNAFDLKQRTNATLLGAPTGGKPNHYGEVREFALPNSGLHIQYATRYWELIPGSTLETLAPDTLIEPTIDDMMAGRDPVLEAALR